MKDKVDKWYIHDGLDRTHTILVMMNELLGFYDPDCEFSDNDMHPAIWNSKCQFLLSEATGKLAELYTAIGEWEDSNKGEKA